MTYRQLIDFISSNLNREIDDEAMVFDKLSGDIIPIKQKFHILYDPDLQRDTKVLELEN